MTAPPGASATAGLLAAGGHVAPAGVAERWWIPSGRATLDPDHFSHPNLARDPYGNVTSLAYDDFDLFVTQVTSPTSACSDTPRNACAAP